MPYFHIENKHLKKKRERKANIFRVKANNSVLCRYFCIGFIDFMLAGEKLTDFTSVFTSFFLPMTLKRMAI